MGANVSALSSPNYGYDMVVAVTQVSLNSTLWQWLYESNQPASYIYLIKDPNLTAGHVVHETDLKAMLSLLGGINPFEIPDQTPSTDSRIVALTKAGFLGGFKIQLGLPPGIMPKDFPIVILGTDAAKMQFNMYCGDISVIQNLPNSWSIWTQADGTPWSVGVLVELVTQQLDASLNTPYFDNSKPKHKAAILASLQKSKDPFSLQQIVFDLNASLSMVADPSFLPAGSFAMQMLKDNFVRSYVDKVIQYGNPPVSIKAIPQTTTDPSVLAVTSLSWEVSSTPGVPTLNYLCSVNGHPLPPGKSFVWSYVTAADVPNESGVIAINRNVIANYILQQILPQAKPCCVACGFSTTAHWQGSASYYWDLHPGQDPEIAMVTPSGPNTIQIKFAPDYDGHLESSGAVSVGLQILPTYTCDVTFQKNIITVTQRMAFRVYVRYDSSSDTCMVVDKAITDEYIISVDQKGSLQTTRKSLEPIDKSESPHNNVILNWFTNINDMLNDIKNSVAPFAATRLKPIEIDSLQNFIFPGARVFTFKSVTFSDSQDLLSEITYVDPNTVDSEVTPKIDSKTTPKTPVNPSQEASVQPQVAPGFPTPNGTDATAAKGSDSASSKTHANAGTNPAPPGNGTASFTSTSSGTANLGPYSLIYSSELIQNYVQGELVSPQAKFEALQTSDGHSLLFAVSTAGVLDVVAESSGTSKTGWTSTDLSSAIISKQFPAATVRTFDVGQSALDGTIGMAMAVSSGGSDHLVVCLSNSNTNTSWIAQPNWLSCPFDAANETRPVISIVGVLFSETISGQQYLIVDIDRALNSAVKDVTRYYVNASKSGGTCWVRHDVPVDIESGNYQSLTGRKVGSLVDGVYTVGKSGTSSQFVYVPIINAFGDGPPAPTRLSLPGNVAVTAIAVARIDSPSSSQHGLTDLYAIGGSTLYCFDTEAQRVDGGIGKAVLTSAMLNGTSQLFAMTHDDVTTLWGKNGSDVLYYTTCPTTKVHMPGSWSTLVPVLTGIEKMSSFVNRSDGGNTIFAAGGGKLQRLIQATATSSKMWQTQPITIDAQPTQPSLSFKSYTTSLQLRDKGSAAAPGVSVAISAKSRSPVYINGLYYTLGPAPINVPTDNNGCLIIVEAITRVHGTVIKVAVGSAASVSINPMDKAFKKLATLNSTDALKSATIPQGTKAGGVIGTAQSKAFVSPTVSDDDIGSAASGMSNLNQAYDDLNAGSKVPSKALLQSKFAVPTRTLFALSSIAVTPGELYQMAASGIEGAFNDVVQIVHDAANDTWTFVATIAGQAYHAILDSIETVVGAVEWVFNQIKTLIEDILLYLELLLSWDDIRRTKEVMCNLIKLYTHDAVSSLGQLRNDIDGKITGLESEINSWSGIKGWPTFGSLGTKPVGSCSSGVQDLTTTGHMFIGHLTNNVDSMSTQGSAVMTATKSILQDLFTAVEQQGEVLEAMGQQIQTLAGEITSISADDLLKRLIGIVADGILSNAQAVVDCLLKVLGDLSSAIMDLLETPVHIPVISDILNALGVSDLSILDLLCWIAAIVTTLAYKIIHGNSAPFSDDTLPDKISAATDWTSLSDSLTAPPQQASEVATSRVMTSKVVVRAAPQDPDSIYKAQAKEQASKWFTVGHAFSGCFQVVKTIVQPLEGMTPSPSMGLSAANISVNVLEAISSFLGNHFGLQEAEAPWLVWMTRSTTLITVYSSLVLSGPVMRESLGDLVPQDTRPISSKVNSILTIPAIVCTAAHLVELSSAAPDKDTAPATFEELSNMIDYVVRWLYAILVDPATPAEGKPVCCAVLVAMDGLRSGVQLYEGFSANLENAI